MRLTLVFLFWVAGVWPMLAASAGATVPTAELLMAPAALRYPKLSPDGTQAVLLRRGEESRYVLAKVELATKQGSVLFHANDASVVNVWWKNPRQLLVLVRNESGWQSFRTVDVVTGKVQMINSTLNYRGLQLVSMLPKDPDKVLFRGIPRFDMRSDLVRVDLRADRLEAVADDPGGVWEWFTDRSGNPFAAWGLDQDRYFVMLRPNASAPWRTLRWPKGTLPDLFPLGIAEDDQHAFLQDYRQSSIGRMVRYDLATGESEEVSRKAGIEPDQLARWGESSEAYGLVYHTDRQAIDGFTPEGKAWEEWLETVLPGTTRSVVSISNDRDRAVVFAESGRQPGSYYLVEKATQRVSAIGSAWPGVDPAGLGASRFFEFKASDGRRITGRVTLPPNGVAKPPAIVLLEGSIDGPRADNVFDPLAQFFAVRGYAAVRVNHRGVEGFGREFRQAAIFHIHDDVVRDITEGLSTLRERGVVDGQRAAVYGSGPSGWVAFQAAMKPGFFRVLLNNNVPLELDPLSARQFTQVGGPWVNWEVRGPGDITSEKYLEGIAPLTVAADLPVASFHRYFFTDPGRRLESTMKANPARHEVVVTSGDRPRIPNLDWRQQAAALEAMANFLAKEL